MFTLKSKARSARECALEAAMVAEEIATKAFEHVHENRLAVSKLLRRLDGAANDDEGCVARRSAQ